jgi:putative flippase GtrA
MTVALSGNHTFAQLVRFGVVGLVSNGILYAAYLALTYLGMEHKAAMTLLYAVGVLQTFAMNKRWSYRHRGAAGLAFVRYGIVYLAGYLLNLGVLLVLVDRLGYPHQLVQGAMIVVIALFTFVTLKLWVFAERPPAAP